MRTGKKLSHQHQFFPLTVGNGIHSITWIHLTRSIAVQMTKAIAENKNTVMLISNRSSTPNSSLDVTQSIGLGHEQCLIISEESLKSY